MRDLARRKLSGHEPRLIDGDGHVPAAVMLLLYERDGEEHVLFQVRTHRVEHHKGEISLPGGAVDADDESLLHTALRETHEEIGVPPDHIEVFGQLDDLVTRANFRMSPFVGAITQPAPYPFEYAAIEVEQLLEVPLPHLLSEQSRVWIPSPLGGGEMRAFQHDEHVIFGATAMVIAQFIDMLAAGGAGVPVGERRCAATDATDAASAAGAAGGP